MYIRCVGCDQLLGVSLVRTVDRTPEATFDAPKSDDHEQEQHEQDIQQEPQDSGGLNDEDPKPKTEDEGENAREETEIARTRGSLRRTKHGDEIHEEAGKDERKAAEILEERDKAIENIKATSTSTPSTGTQEEDDEKGFAGFEEEAKADELARAEEKLQKARDVALRRSIKYDKLVVKNAEVKKKAIDKENTTFGFLVEDEVSEIRKQFMEKAQAEEARRNAEAEALKPKSRWVPPPKKDMPLSKAAMGVPDNLVDSDYEDEVPPPKPQDMPPEAAPPAELDRESAHQRDNDDQTQKTAESTQAQRGDEGLVSTETADPEWLHHSVSKADAELRLCADGGLSKQGRFLVRTLADRKSEAEYVLSVVFQGACTHHTLEISPTEVQLNGTALPSEVTNLAETVEFLGTQRQELMWPLELTSPVVCGTLSRDTSNDGEATGPALSNEEFGNVFGGEVESSDEEESAQPGKETSEDQQSEKILSTSEPLPFTDRTQRETLLSANNGLAETGRFVISPIEEGSVVEYVVSVVFRSQVTHHKLTINENGDFKCYLNEDELPPEITTLEEAIAHLQEERPKWPLALTVQVFPNAP